MTDITNKPNLLGSCRSEVLETLADKFHDAARSEPNATALEVLFAAATFTLTAAKFIPDPTQRAAILNALVDTSLQ